ncbi:RagB/SusD family nutrient uptake outer membrane protein [Flavobacterium daejeonense]|uniref:RagB/SusD family nutrient uptake outer membrane protein n=1 Tax=Flavobacterium daejeonense TaxID=350893 RepID=UPI00047D6112|nr:RagB/SusD family nutrient uptake outer membrane protein [Flavobacterium daejeonense]
MKTKINRYLALALLIILGASCSDDFLQEKKNYGQVDNSFYESQERADWYINKLYYNFYYGYNSPLSTIVGSFSDASSYYTEERAGIQNLINPAISYSTINDISNVTSYYGAKLGASLTNNPYTRIRDINSFIVNVDIYGSNLDQTYRDQAKGQMYYLRAMQYFDLMRVYGGVPIVTTVQNGSSTDESIKLPRASVGEVVAQITKDLDKAAELLPNNWNAANYGRFTKGAAMAQKARVLLTYASPLFNKNWDTDNTRWQAALDAGLAAETQLTQDGYGLYGSSAKDWANMFLIDNAFCKEAITVKLLSSNQTVAENSGWEKGLRPVSQGGGGAFEAPKEMIDLFPMKDGAKPVAGTNYDPFIFFKDRDPRFYRTFTFSGDKYAYKENTNSVLWAYRYVDVNDKGYFSDNNQESSPAFVRKMSNPAASNSSAFQYSSTDIMEYRYAELLLNIAESYAALGDIPNTIAYIGKVRNRVGIPSVNNYGLGTLADKYAAINAALYERRVELAYEGKRFWDVQRWMLYSDDAVSGITNNTCAKLGLTPINGTKRTGHYLQYKNAVPAPVPANTTPPDPLAAQRALLSPVDPDSANFAAQIAALETFYNNNFVLADLITPLDSYNNVASYIDWKPNYYINGLQTGVLSYNPWLEQTIGWGDASGSTGTFNYQE